MNIQALIDTINDDAQANRLFWVAGLAREVWPVLLPYLDALHPWAQEAVAHYSLKAKTTQLESR